MTSLIYVDSLTFINISLKNNKEMELYVYMYVLQGL